MNKGVAISYGDVAPEAKENFIPKASESLYGDAYQTQLMQYSLAFPNYANPCELYSVVLDGQAMAYPSIPEKANFGLVSNQLSGADGIFAEPITIELQSAGQYTSQGLTLTFDTQNEIYPNDITIKWMRVTSEENTILFEKTFNPNSASYFCKNLVENYNKIIITFNSLNMPYNRLKFRAIDYGYGTVFTGAELRKTKLIQEIDPISSQISINTADFTLDSKSDIQYSFQARQPLSIYFDGKLKATTFVKSAKRKAKFLWEVQSEDYIGLMDSVSFYGGIYQNKDAYELMQEIFNTAKVPYAINEKLHGVTVSGYIPFSSCRSALMQVAFATQNVVDTSDSDVVKVFALDDEIKQTVPLDRIMQGQNFVDDDTVTAVEVSSHTYKPTTETLIAYEAQESGAGDNIFVKFKEPLHSVTINGGTIVEVGANYAIINASSTAVLRGGKYEHTVEVKRKNNPVVLANDTEKILAIDQATLVSSSNIDTVLEKCYNWLVKTNTINVKIVEGKHIISNQAVKYGQAKYGDCRYAEDNKSVVIYDKPVNVGEMIEVDTEYLGTLSGRLVKQTFNLSGNIIVKEAVMK